MGYMEQSSSPAAVAPIPMASFPFITTIGRSEGIVGISTRKSRFSPAQLWPNSRSATFFSYTSSDFFLNTKAIWSRMSARSRS